MKLLLRTRTVTAASQFEFDMCNVCVGVFFVAGARTTTTIVLMTDRLMYVIEVLMAIL